MLPVAPGGTGQPPSSPKLDSNESTPGLERGVARSRAPGRACCGSARSARRSRQRRSRARRRTRAPGPGWPSRSCRRSRSPARPPPRSRRGDLEHALGRRRRPRRGSRTTTLITPSQRSPASRARGQHALEPGQRLLDRAVDVLAVVGLRRRQEDVDLVEPLAQLRARCSSPRSLGISTRRLTLRRGRRSRSSTSRRVGELRDHVGADEARHLEPPAGRCARARRSARTLSSVGITSGSFWKPSRGPTSRIRA